MIQIVFVKQVPFSTKVKMDPVTHTLVRSGVRTQVNPYDLHAVRAAIEVKDQCGGTVVVVTMGPPSAVAVLREAMMHGADEAVLVSDAAFAGSDTWSTSYILSMVVRHLGGADIQWFGKQAIDGDTAQVGPGVAAQLNYPQITEMNQLIEVDEHSVTVQKVTDYGYRVVKSGFPVVITVNKEANQLLSPSLNDWLRAENAEIRTINASSLQLDMSKVGLSGSPTRVKRIELPSTKQDIVMLTSAHELAQVIKNLRK